MNSPHKLSLGLKLWSNNDNYLREAERLAGERVCRYVELYVVPGTLSQFGPSWKSIEVPYVIHAPHTSHGMNLAVKESAQSNRKLAEETFAFADMLGAEHLIFHPGVAGEDLETIRQLSDWPESRRKRILLENKPYRSIENSPRICNGHSPEHIAAILEKTGVGFCFDIGHGICSSNSRNADPWKELREYENLRPVMYHLSDNDFRSEFDAHLHLGEGNYDFGKIFDSIDLTRRISLETRKNDPQSLADFEEDVLHCEHRYYNLDFLRPEEKDSREVFELANEPGVRKNSIHTEPICWESHQSWFREKLQSPDGVFYIVRDKNGGFCGYVRYDFDRQKNSWICSIAVSPPFRGRGIAAFFLKSTQRLFFREHNESIRAWIKKENIPSIRAFQRAGYRFLEQVRLNDVSFFVYELPVRSF